MIRRVKRRVNKGVKKIWATLTLLSLELVVVLVSFFVALFGFLFIARMIFFKKKEQFDNDAFAFLGTLVNDFNTDVMQFFTFLGTHYFLIPANLLLIAYYLFVKKHRWYSIKIPVVSIGSLLMMSVLKNLFHRPRPLIPLLNEARGFGFPSGHATMSFAFYGLLMYIVWQNVENRLYRWILVILLFILILHIGVSRIYLRVHYASDVLAGFSLGIIWLVVSLSVLNRMENISRKEVDLVVEK
jgi:membrane-associated phospholipid phosphatase